jgi:hypothetical protein
MIIILVPQNNSKKLNKKVKKKRDSIQNIKINKIKMFSTPDSRLQKVEWSRSSDFEIKKILGASPIGHIHPLRIQLGLHRKVISVFIIITIIIING